MIYNTASLHPELHSNPKLYYQEVETLKASFKRRLAELFSLDFDYYIMHNTTSALTTVLCAINLNNSNLEIHESCYWNYKSLSSATYRKIKEPSIRLSTHIDPLTGNKLLAEELISTENLLTIVDGAQSVGTNCQNEVFENAAIVIFPFHKNLGVNTGIGCLALNKSKLFPGILNRIEVILKMYEAGCLNYNILADGLSRLNEIKSNPVNSVKLEVSNKFIESLERYNIKLVTRVPIYANIISLTSSNGAKLSSFLNVSKLECKYFSKENILRYSFHSYSTKKMDEEILEKMIISDLLAAWI